MASDVILYIADPSTGTIVFARWVGMSGTIKRVRSIVARSPDHKWNGNECWGHLTAAEAIQIAESSYDGGIKPEEVLGIAQRFPTDRYWWMIHHDF